MLIVFIAFFAFSQGAVIWVYLARDLPDRRALARPGARQRDTLGHECASSRQAFPMIAAYTQALPFVFFAACMVVQFFVVLAVFPETRGVELESMDEALKRSA